MTEDGGSHQSACVGEFQFFPQNFKVDRIQHYNSTKRPASFFSLGPNHEAVVRSIVCQYAEGALTGSPDAKQMGS